MRIQRSIALEVYAAIGVPSAAKWDKAKLEGKLKALHTLEGAAETTLDDERLNRAYRALLAKGAAGEPIEVTHWDGTETAAAPAPATETEATEEAQAAPTAAKPGRKRLTPAEKEAKVAEAEKKAAEKKAAKVAAKAEGNGAAKTPRKGQSYYAGLVFKRYGFANGITDEMVAALGTAMGRTNPDRDRDRLDTILPSLRSYAEGNAAELDA